MNKISLDQSVGQCLLAQIVSLEKHQLELTVDILNLLVDLLIRYEKVVTSRDLLHDMSLNQVIFQNCHPIVNQDWWLGCLKVTPEVSWRSLHVNRRDLQRDRLELGQQIQIHEIFLAENAGSLPPAVNSGGLYDELNLWYLGHLLLLFCFEF